MGAHLVEASSDELIEAHKRVGVEAARVFVVVGRGVEGFPLLHHKELGPDLQGFVGARHKEGGGNIFAGRGGYFQHQGEAGETIA